MDQLLTLDGEENLIDSLSSLIKQIYKFMKHFNNCFGNYNFPHVRDINNNSNMCENSRPFDRKEERK